MVSKGKPYQSPAIIQAVADALNAAEDEYDTSYINEGIPYNGFDSIEFGEWRISRQYIEVPNPWYRPKPATLWIEKSKTILAAEGPWVVSHEEDPLL